MMSRVSKNGKRRGSRTQNAAAGKMGNRTKYAAASATRLSDQDQEQDGCGSLNEYEAADQHLLRRSFNR